MEIDELNQIIGILKENNVTEFELQRSDGTHIKLSRPAPLVTQATGISSIEIEPAIVPVANGQQPHAVVSGGKDQRIVDDNLTAVESPIVGTFYRKPAPDQEAFVKEGDRVEKGDTLCIIEAMKLMNEIEAPCSGTIAQIHISDGSVVEFGEVLFSIKA